MRVLVELLGPLAKLAGSDEVWVEVGRGACVLEALRALCKILPPLSVIFDPDTGDPRTNFLILLNGRDVDVLGGLEARLREGDKLSLIPLMRL